MDWQEAIKQWRALPEAEKQRLRWQSIPLKVARSFAFEGEPVSLAALQAEHPHQAPTLSKPTTLAPTLAESSPLRGPIEVATGKIAAGLDSEETIKAFGANLAAQG